MELSSSKIKLFLYFCIWNFLASYFSYIPGRNFPSSKSKKKNTLKKFIISQENEFYSPKLKKFFTLSGGTSKAPKFKISYTFPKKVMNKFFCKLEFFKFSELLEYKTSKAFFFVESFFSFWIFFIIYKFTIKFGFYYITKFFLIFHIFIQKNFIFYP